MIKRVDLNGLFYSWKSLRPGLDVEFHMRRIKYPFELLGIKTAAFHLDVVFYMRRIEFVSAGNMKHTEICVSFIYKKKKKKLKNMDLNLIFIKSALSFLRVNFGSRC